MQVIVPRSYKPLAWPREWYDRPSRMLSQNAGKSHQSECSYLKLVLWLVAQTITGCTHERFLKNPKTFLTILRSDMGR